MPGGCLAGAPCAMHHVDACTGIGQPADARRTKRRPRLGKRVFTLHRLWGEHPQFEATIAPTWGELRVHSYVGA
jgi:hypothetical protein